MMKPALLDETREGSPFTFHLSPFTVRRLGRSDYHATWEAMRRFTEARGAATPDEIWLTEHPPVFTLGQAGRREHLLRETAIPVVKSDRGGQITYHGPGQIVAYLLLDLRRRKLTVKTLVQIMEQAVIELLAARGVAASRRRGAPGVYVDGAKVAALGLRIRRGCSYHGLAFNADMDLAPFGCIHPCGYEGLRVTQARDLGIQAPLAELADELARALITQLESRP